jgi:hypothetical protein
VRFILVIGTPRGGNRKAKPLVFAAALRGLRVPEKSKLENNSIPTNANSLGIQENIAHHPTAAARMSSRMKSKWTPMDREAALLDYAEGLRKFTSGRRAVHLHLSKIRPFNRRARHMRVAISIFDELIREFDGVLCQPTFRLKSLGKYRTVVKYCCVCHNT